MLARPCVALALLAGALEALSPSALRRVAGGEWAGWECAFTLRGESVPVADHYLPEALVEWGQAPRGFEVLCTEEVGADAWTRAALRMLPEEGCNSENLAAERPPPRAWDLAADAVALPPGLAAFGAGGELQVLVPRGDEGRVRVELGLSGAELRPLVRVSVERRWSAESGMLPAAASSGSRTGIDAAWLAKTIGAPCFAEGATAGDAQLGGETAWIPGARLGLRAAPGDKKVGLVFQGDKGDLLFSCAYDAAGWRRDTARLDSIPGTDLETEAARR